MSQGFGNLQLAYPARRRPLLLGRGRQEELTWLGEAMASSRGEGGSTAIEVALIVGLIALAIIAMPNNIGLKLSSYFSEVSSALK